MLDDGVSGCQPQGYLCGSEKRELGVPKDGEGTLTLKHTIPNIGLVRFPVYPPADELVALLQATGEMSRLKQLKHVGALESALPGITHSRWDYVMSMLYVASRIEVPGGNSKFKVGSAEFSSAIAAVQCAALLSNIGHLPGTFAVEKGVARYLWDINRERPLEELRKLLEMTEPSYSALDSLREPVRDYLWASDYARVNRILGLLKAAQWVVQNELPNRLGHVLGDFYVWLLFPDTDGNSLQWNKVYRLFELVRRLSYLNLDSSFSDAPVRVIVSRLVGESDTESPNRFTVDDLERIMEVLSSYEHVVYWHLYHRPECRSIVAIVAALVHQKLAEAKQPGELVRRWLTGSDIGVVFDISYLEQENRINQVASITTRSHFVSMAGPIARLESDLRRKVMRNAGCASVLSYRPWLYEARMEPDEFTVDLYSHSKGTPALIGRFIAWVMRELDYREKSSDDVYGLLCKQDIEGIYAALLAHAVLLSYQDVRLELSAWPLSRLGLFPGNDSVDQTRVWASSATLDTPFIEHIVRRRSKPSEPSLRSLQAELQGLVRLRNRLSREMQENSRYERSVSRFLVLTSSVRLTRGDERLMEFDGGIVKVNIRTGAMTFYGLETKSSRSGEHAANSLERRLREKMGIATRAKKLGKSSAFVELTWR